MRLILPFPPSINGYWRSFKGRQIISERGRNYRRDVLTKLRGWNQPPLTRELEVVIELFPPDKRKRDVDNYTKGALDALTHAGVWHDDHQIRRMTVERHSPVTGGALHITVSEYEAAQIPR